MASLAVRRARLIAAGLCREACGNKAAAGKKRCDSCLSKQRAINKGNPSRHRRSLYGEDGVDRLARQAGLCAVCRRPLDIGHSLTHIDHCHDCNGVRSVLCHRCNMLEGFASKLGDPVGALKRLVAYLDHHWASCPDHDGRPVATRESRI